MSNPPPSKPFSDCVCVQDVEKKAMEILPKATRGYYGGTADEQTMARNQSALNRYLIRPLTLRDVSKIDTTVHLQLTSNGNCFDKTLSFPLAIAPTASHCLAHPDGELATVKAAGETKTIMICSSFSTISIEEIAKAAPEGTILWFQVSMCKDKRLTESLAKRAIAAGFHALIVTGDPVIEGRIRNNVRDSFTLPAHFRLPNFEAFYTDGSGGEQADLSNIRRNVISLINDALTWKDLEWLIGMSSIPVILKGVMRPDDAERAIAAGVAGIVVSNLGGRSSDHAPSTIEALSEISATIKDRCPLFMDGGIRSGTDIFKAIALGAQTVFIGRPILYGLAIGGEEGVKHVIGLLRKEFENAMKLSGCSTLQQIRSNHRMVVHESHYSKF